MSRPSERPAASAAHDGAREREPGPSATRRRPEAALLFWPLGPGSRFARPGHDGRVGVNQLRGSSLQSSGIPLHPAAPLGVRVVPFFSSPPPKRGWRSADRRTLLVCRACEARRPRERNAGRPVATGTPSRRSVVAIFGRGPALPPPAVAPEPASDLPASGHTARWAGSRTSRAAVRAAIAGHHSPLHRQDRLRRRPL